MSSHCGRYPSCGCDSYCGTKCHLQSGDPRLLEKESDNYTMKIFSAKKSDFDDFGKEKKEISKTIKQSRNDICFCGSGKKYKRCCIKK